MSQHQFTAIAGSIAVAMADRPLDDGPARLLTVACPAAGGGVAALKRLCAEGEARGRPMAREAGGMGFGRAVRPGTDAGASSVDCVRIADARGPCHAHPPGEAGLAAALAVAPECEGLSESRYVCPPGSDHRPTVSGGEACVLYFLPRGEIDFTGQ